MHYKSLRILIAVFMSIFMTGTSINPLVYAEMRTAQTDPVLITGFDAIENVQYLEVGSESVPSLPTSLNASIDGQDSKVSVPVTWSLVGENEFSTASEGSFVYKAGITSADYTVADKLLPTITVMVTNTNNNIVSSQIISSFNVEQSDLHAEVIVGSDVSEGSLFPSTISVMIEGDNEPKNLDISWAILESKKFNTSSADTFQYELVLPEGYTLKDGVNKPIFEINVVANNNLLNANPVEHTHNEITFTEWNSADSLPDSAGAYYLVNDITLSNPWTVPLGTLNLCLNGKTISIQKHGNDNPITVSGGSTLSIYDEPSKTGKILGSSVSGSTSNRCFHVENGYLNLYGGTISNFTDSGNGGAIYLAGTNAHLLLDGASIINNHSGLNGGAIYDNSANLTIKSGIISGNSASGVGGGIFVNASSVEIEGNISITKNKRGNGATTDPADNVCFYGNNSKFTITGNVDVQSIVGVTKTNSSSTYAPLTGILTAGLKGKGSLNSFVSDNSDYEIKENSSGEAELLSKTKYVITISDTQYGTVSVDKSENKAASGEIVSITAIPSEGYTLDSISVFKTEDPTVNVTLNEDNSFTMPPYPVTISATFAEPIAKVTVNESDIYCSNLAKLADFVKKSDTTYQSHIQLLKNIALETNAINKLTINRNVVLDLNGHSITRNNVISDSLIEVTCFGTLTILDSSATHTGIISGSVDGKAVIEEQESGKGASVILESGMIRNNSTTENSSGIYIKADGGSLTINGGAIVTTGNPISFDSQDENPGLSLSGGYFSSRIESYQTYITDGYSIEEKNTQSDWLYNDCSYRISNAKKVARIILETGVEKGKYSSIADAISNWVDGSTLELLADVETLNTIIVPEGSEGYIFNLNGYGVKYAGSAANSVFTVGEGRKLTIKNDGTHASATHKYTLYNGGAGLAVVDDTEGTVSFTGGYITGGKGTLGGEQTRGGGIYVHGGTVAIQGGTIIGNQANYGGGVMAQSSNVSISSSAAIIGNYANEVNGGGVYIEDYSSFEMSGGSIRYNKAKQNGGGVYIRYGGVDSQNTFELYGGTITNNECGRYYNGGGVYVAGSNNCEIQGSPVVKDNLNNGIASNLCISDPLFVVGFLSSSASIGVTKMLDGGKGIFTSTDSEDLLLNDDTKFSSDNSDYFVIKKDKGENTGQLELFEGFIVEFNSNGGTTIKSQAVENGGKATEPTPPTKKDYDFDGWYSDEALETPFSFDTPINKNYILNAKWKLKPHIHDGIEFTRWTATNSLPTEAGNYYLADDVKLTSTWEINEKNISLCLNGNTITTSSNINVISISSTSVLNLFDCDEDQRGFISGGYETQNVITVNGRFNMHGGKITGPNSNTGVLLNDSNAVFNMTGGKIYGLAVKGVNVSQGAFKVSGNPIIYQNGWNQTISSFAGDVCLSGEKKVIIEGALDQSASIGVKMETPGVFSEGLSDKGSIRNFFSSDTKYVVNSTTEGEAELTQTAIVNFDKNCDDNVTGMPDPISLPIDEKFIVSEPENAPVRIGYVFAGWYTVPDPEPRDIFHGDYFDQRPMEGGPATHRVLYSSETAYAVWVQPIDKVNVTLDAPICGTAVTIDLYEHSSNPMPNAIIDETQNYQYFRGMWLDSVPLHSLSFTIEGGKNYQADLYLIPKKGYYFSENVETIVNGRVVTSSSSGSLLNIYLEQGIEAVHKYENWNIITQSIDGAAGTESSICVGGDAPQTKAFRYVTESGSGNKWTKGSTNSSDFVFKRTERDEVTFANCTGVLVDNNLLTSEKDYDAEKGSLKLSLRPSYLNQLSVGEHTLLIRFSDGTISTKFTVIEENKPSGGGSTPSKKTDNVVTCQMAGFPANYAWNEAAKACQPGYIDAGGNFHPYRSVRRTTPNTSDNGNLTMYVIAMFLMTFVAYITAKRLVEDSNA